MAFIRREMNPISAVFLLVSVVFSADAAPQGFGVGNAMQPEIHATALVPMITGTNVPDSEEEIDAPIYDQREIDRVKGLMKQTIDSKGDMNKLPILGNVDPGIQSTAETLRASGVSSAAEVLGTDDDLIVDVTSPKPIFTLAGGLVTVGVTTAKSA